MFLDLNGDLLPRPRRNSEDMLAKMRQIKRGGQRHRLAVARQRQSAGFLRRPQRIHFPGHAFLQQVARQTIAGMWAKKEMNWPKTFLLKAAVLPYNFRR
jgi:hypothetical protein